MMKHKFNVAAAAAAAAQGISQAGHQQGINDARSCLVKHIFRVYDCLAPAKNLA